MVEMIFPKANIRRLRYFTALVSSTPTDPQKRQRQLTYIRALETITEVTVTYGSFMTHEKWQPLVNPQPGGPTRARVSVTEEKSTDVNIAGYLVFDACNGEFQQAIVITNDTD